MVEHIRVKLVFLVVKKKIIDLSLSRNCSEGNGGGNRHISRNTVNLLGKLTDVYIPVSNFLVEPYIGWINPASKT